METNTPTLPPGFTDGTVIHATLRPEDLIPVLTYELECILGLGLYDQSYFVALHDGQAWNPGMDADETDATLEGLFDALDAIAPEGYYFGATEGDGADFGFWPVDEDPPYIAPCAQCSSSVVNGVFCHERGCPNSGQPRADLL